jgi:hypothetical protein
MEILKYKQNNEMTSNFVTDAKLTCLKTDKTSSKICQQYLQSIVGIANVSREIGWLF